MGFVGYILTSAVLDLYGTNIVLEPSLPLRPEFRRSSRCPRACFFDRWLSHLRTPYAPDIIEMSKASVAARRVALEVLMALKRMIRSHAVSEVETPSSEQRRVDCTAILPLFHTLITCDLFGRTLSCLDIGNATCCRRSPQDSPAIHGSCPNAAMTPTRNEALKCCAQQEAV